MRKAIAIVALTLSCLGFISAEDQCRDVPLQANFDATKYTGIWFEQARDQYLINEVGDCQRAKYSINEDGTLAVYNTMYDPKTDKIDSASATATCVGPKCLVDFGNPGPKGDYRVLSTDYTSYVIVYSCTAVPGRGKFQYAWVLARDVVMQPETIKLAVKTLHDHVPEYNINHLYYTVQGKQCKYPQDE